MPASPETLLTLRRLILLLLGVGLAATVLELWLIGHDEDTRQRVPLMVAGPALLALAWYAAAPGLVSVSTLRLTAVALVVSGAAGVYFHFRGNMEFQLELDPSLAGFALARKVLRAKSPPALAPGQMALLGLLGLAVTYGERGDRKRKEPV